MTQAVDTNRKVRNGQIADPHLSCFNLLPIYFSMPGRGMQFERFQQPVGRTGRITLFFFKQ